MGDRGRILYVTFDGILEPLGYSQVLRLVERLSTLGFDYTILSLERGHDLDDAERVRAVGERLASRGITWAPLRYDGAGSARAILRNVARATRAALSLHVRRRFDLVHARSYFAGMVALSLRASTGLPYVLDARGYLFDERIEEGRWLKGEMSIGAARLVERRLYRWASAVVTLTELQAEDLKQGIVGPWTGRPVLTVPTCADYIEFRPRDGRSDAAIDPEVRARLEGKVVLGWIGSINNSYKLAETFDLTRTLFNTLADVHLLALTGQVSAFESAVGEHRLDPSRVTIRSVPHEAMPAWLPRVDWGLLILNESRAKRASMPTKLGEFFAAGVRPIQHGCNTEVGSWVERAGTGIVLPSLDPASYERAARRVLQIGDERSDLEAARERTRAHFDLGSGAQRYAVLFDALLAAPGGDAIGVPAFVPSAS